MSETLRRPETDVEREAVREFVDRMLYHPSYDTMTLLELRRDVDNYLCGFRGDHLVTDYRQGEQP